MMKSRILLTGAAGALGRQVRAAYTGRCALLRSSDIVAMDPPGPGEETVIADLADAGAVAGLCQGIDSIIHLGGRATEGDWPTVISANILGLINLYEGALQAGVKRILFASSNHAIGLHRRSERLDHTGPARPDGRYGLSKAFGEDLSALYAYKHDIKGFCLRIGSSYPKPVNRRMLSTWLSYGDLVRLIDVGLTADYTYEIVYGISRNTRAWWDNSRAYALGYDPQDDAEIYAGDVGEIVSGDPLEEAFQGGGFVTPEFIGSPDRIP